MSIIAASRLRASSINPNAFIIEVDTSKAGSASNSFQFTNAVGDYNVIAKQGGSVVATFDNLSGEETIVLPSVGVYVLEVRAKVVNGFTGFQFDNSADKLKLLKVIQWGVFNDTRVGLFFGCSNLTQIADDNDWLNSITNGISIFQNCGLTSLPSTLTLNSLLDGFRFFLNCNLTSLPAAMTLNNLTDAREMFFDNPLTSLPSNMNLSSLILGNNMFRDCNLSSLPSGMTLNNLTIGVTMFRDCSLTALPSNMNLSSLVNGENMFETNSITDLPSGMTLPNLTNGADFLEGNTINTTRYSELLENMEINNSNNNVPFNAGNSKYNTDGETARDLLTNNQSWSFTDGGLE
jgi:hypothetical protein